MRKKGVTMLIVITLFFNTMLTPSRVSAEPITITLGVIGLVSAAWTFGTWASGARAVAFAQADEDWETDPTGITIAQALSGDFPMKGGWFSTGEHAIAPAVGSKGSKLTTDADCDWVGPAYSGSVTFPVRELGKPNGSYWGLGWARGTKAQMIQKIGSPLLVDMYATLEIQAVDLNADPHQGYMYSHVTFDAWVTDGNSYEFGDAVWSQSFVDSTVELAGGESPYLSFDGNLFEASMFSPISVDGEGFASNSLISPISVNYSFTVPVPDNWDSFCLIIEGGADSQTAAVIPEPATLVLLAVGGLALVRRRRKT